MKNLKQSVSILLVFCFITFIFTGCKPAYTDHEHQWVKWTATGSMTNATATGKCPCGQAITITGTLEEISNQLPSSSAIAFFGAWLDIQPPNTSVTAYNVKLNLSSLGEAETISGTTITVWSLGQALRTNNTKYVKLDLSGSSFTSIGDYVFSYCDNLTSITIPSSVTKIEKGAFSSCDNLTSVTFSTGSNISAANFGNGAFPERDGWTVGGDSLKTAYLSANPKAGTYTRAVNGSVWTKQ